MDTVRRHRQGAVDCRSKRMDQIRPFWFVHPQCARAARAEMALSGAGPAAALLLQLGAVDAEPFATPDLQARAVAHQIDGIAAASRRLSADRAFAAWVRLRGGHFSRQAEDAAAATSLAQI